MINNNGKWIVSAHACSKYGHENFRWKPPFCRELVRKAREESVESEIATVFPRIVAN